jgi:hypothetical protein
MWDEQSKSLQSPIEPDHAAENPRLDQLRGGLNGLQQLLKPRHGHVA